MTTPACEDFDTIRHHLEALKRERDAMLARPEVIEVLKLNPYAVDYCGMPDAKALMHRVGKIATARQQGWI